MRWNGGKFQKLWLAKVDKFCENQQTLGSYNLATGATNFASSVALERLTVELLTLKVEALWTENW
jgi:hypothetical protein